MSKIKRSDKFNSEQLMNLLDEAQKSGVIRDLRDGCKVFVFAPAVIKLLILTSVIVFSFAKGFELGVN